MSTPPEKRLLIVDEVKNPTEFTLLESTRVIHVVSQDPRPLEDQVWSRE